MNNLAAPRSRPVRRSQHKTAELLAKIETREAPVLPDVQTQRDTVESDTFQVSKWERIREWLIAHPGQMDRPNRDIAEAIGGVSHTLVGAGKEVAEVMKIIVFDVESNGLHGEGFAVGACCLHLYDAHLVDDWYFEGRAPITEPVDDWVGQHVIPVIHSLPLYETRRALRDAFWTWFQKHKQGAVIVGDFGVPVESNFLAACQADDPSRALDGPYPLHELGTLLMAAGVDPDINRRQFSNRSGHYASHNPYEDALTSAFCWKRAWRIIQERERTIKEALGKMDQAGIWTGADDNLNDRLSVALQELEHARGKR